MFDFFTLTTFDNVIMQGFWEVAPDSFTADVMVLGLSGRTTILDTGTTLIIAPLITLAPSMPPSPVRSLMARADSQSRAQHQPLLHLRYVTPPSPSTIGISFSPVDPTDLTGGCVSDIPAGVVGVPNEWLVGAVFLKNAYFSTNVDNNQIQPAKCV